jgi:hypothetical protein
MEQIISIGVFYRSNQPDGINYEVNERTCPEQDYLNVFHIMYRDLPNTLAKVKAMPNQEGVKEDIMAHLNELTKPMRPAMVTTVGDLGLVMQLVYCAVAYGLIPNDEFNGILVITPKSIEMARKLRNGGQWN